MKKLSILVVHIFFFFAASAQKDYTRYVNPFIGTGGHGHTFPGVTLPHGMLQLSPDTRLDGWDGCSGYHYTDHFIYGFTHTHLSGTGVSDYGDILLMPGNGKPSFDPKVYGSGFSHATEKASPGYYSVTLEDDQIKAEFTGTDRVGMHHYVFSNSSGNNIILDLKHRDEVIESSIHFEDSVTVTGLRRSKAWATNQYVFFVIKFSRPIVGRGIWNNDEAIEGNRISVDSSRNIKAWFMFDLPETKDIYVKVAISGVNIEGAKKNMQAEMPGWNFDIIKDSAVKKWNHELSKIEVDDSNLNAKRIFYTALYHTAITPNINMDVDQQYRGRDNQIHHANNFINYSVFSLWDTYRGAHPLYVIIDRARTLDYIKTFLAQYQQGGRLPVWELAANETDCMIGYHSVSVIVDAYMKGIRGFDTELALQAMKKSAEWNHLGLPAYREKGVIEAGDESESVSKTLEYAYDDWCIAQFAKATGHGDDYNLFSKRAQYYKNVLDTKTGFMRPRKNGDWIEPFEPREVNNNFTEANSWQYSFYFPQDIRGYMKLTGGKAVLAKKLDYLFASPQQTTGRNQSDITGLIGQYAHGNEPSHHIIYLYDHVGLAYKTQAWVHKVISEMYHDDPDGLIGNEDCGQMSAWYVLSAMGFYPVTPGTTHYEIGTPLFRKVQINLENGQSFSLQANNLTASNFYIRNFAIDGITMSQVFLDYNRIQKGGNLIFNMGSGPSALDKLSNDDTEVIDTDFVINPTIHGGNIPFKRIKTVSITAQKGNRIYYSLDGSIPTMSGIQYRKSLSFDTSVVLKAISVNRAGKMSLVTTAQYHKINHDWSLIPGSKFSAQYNAGGADGLIDGIYGSTDWRKGNWQGYQKTNLYAVIDLKKQQLVNTVIMNFLQDTRAWIVVPKEIVLEASMDGKLYHEIYRGSEYLPITDLNVQIKKITATFEPVKARFVKIKAMQYGKLPSWHEGAGGDTHIFIDEIEVR